MFNIYKKNDTHEDHNISYIAVNTDNPKEQIESMSVAGILSYSYIGRIRDRYPGHPDTYEWIQSAIADYDKDLYVVISYDREICKVYNSEYAAYKTAACHNLLLCEDWLLHEEKIEMSEARYWLINKYYSAIMTEAESEIRHNLSTSKPDDIRLPLTISNLLVKIENHIRKTIVPSKGTIEDAMINIAGL